MLAKKFVAGPPSTVRFPAPHSRWLVLQGNISRVGLLCVPIMCLLLAGCGLFGGQDVGERTARGGNGRLITVDELDQITKSFADRYVLLVANACDDIKRRTTSTQKRRDAHRLKLTTATAAFDAATGPDPVKQLLDLAVSVQIQKIVWVDEKQADRYFGADLSGHLIEALATGEKEIWGLCTRAMKSEQIRALQEAIRKWRQANPVPQWIADIKFDVVAGAQGATLGEGFLGTLSPASGSAADAVGQARLLSQRAFYYLKRFPLLMDWQAEATFDNALSAADTSELGRGLARTFESTAGLLAQLDDLASSRWEKDGAVNPTLVELRKVLSEVNALALSVREAVAAFAELKESFCRPADSFDIKEYTAAAAQFAQAIRETTGLLREVRGLTESEQAMRRVERIVEDVARAAAHQRLAAIDHAAWRMALLIIFAAFILLIYTLLLLRLLSKRRAPTPPPES